MCGARWSRISLALIFNIRQWSFFRLCFWTSRRNDVQFWPIYTFSGPSLHKRRRITWMRCPCLLQQTVRQVYSTGWSRIWFSTFFNQSRRDVRWRQDDFLSYSETCKKSIRSFRQDVKWTMCRGHVKVGHQTSEMDTTNIAMWILIRTFYRRHILGSQWKCQNTTSIKCIHSPPRL